MFATAVPAVLQRTRRRPDALATNLAGDLPPIRCRPAHFDEVLVTLSDNAADAMRTAERWELEIVTLADHDDVLILVVDTGAAVPDALRDVITQPAPDAGTPSPLRRTRDLVVALGGSLAARRLPTGRTAVVVRLPRALHGTRR